MRQELDAARYAREALHEVRQQQGRAWSRRERHVGLALAFIGVLTPYVLLAIRWHTGH